MTSITIIFKDKATGKIYASPEFNGDKMEFEMLKLDGKCDADWSDILKEFSGVKTIQEFKEATIRAQKHYAPFRIFNELTKEMTKLGSEMLPIYEITDVSDIESCYIVNLTHTKYKVEGTIKSRKHKNGNYCLEMCGYCMTEVFNIPTIRISVCPRCGFEIRPCSVCETKYHYTCGYNREKETVVPCRLDEVEN